MSECYGCAWDKVGCRWQDHFPTDGEKPCKCHTEQELAKRMKEYADYRRRMK